MLEYATDAIKRVLRDGRQQNMAPRTILSGGLWDTPASPSGPVWVATDADVAELTPGDPTEFDSVITCAIPIKAGDPIGYLGLYETLASPKGGVKSRHQVHVELFSTDPNLETFLKNPAGLKDGKQYFRVARGKTIYNKSGTEAAPVFTPSGQVIDENYVIEPNLTKLIKAPDNKEWYRIKVNTATTPVDGFITKQDGEMISQYDWEKLGFQIIKETNDNADGFLDPQAIPEFYQSLYLKIDQLGNKDGKVMPDEISNALKNTKLRNRWSKLVAYHSTEWQAKSSETKWKLLDGLLKDAPEVLRHEKERIDNLVFWDSISAAIPTLANPCIHHLHPLATLDMFMQRGELIDVESFIEKYTSQHESFMANTPAFSQVSKGNLRTIVEYINKYYESDSAQANLFELAYMFATARHEAYYFPTGEFFSSKPEVGNVAYFNKYDPVLAATQEHRDRAVGCENTVQGDGYKYRGRGLVHLTWKKNYRKAKEYFGVDFVTQPDKAAEPEHSVPIMIWGMKEGIFTNKKLADYISASGVDYANARKIINGTDQQTLIAGYAQKFEAILRETSSAKETFTP